MFASLATNFTAETTQKILTKFVNAACIKISKTFVLYMNLPSNCYIYIYLFSSLYITLVHNIKLDLNKVLFCSTFH
jgi:hypothetical protein